MQRNRKTAVTVGTAIALLHERQNEKYRRMGPLSRPLMRPGQWSQNTTGISQPAARHERRSAYTGISLTLARS